MTKKFKANTGDGTLQQAQQEFIVRELAGKDKAALEYLLKTRHGRWFLARLMKADGLHAATFTGNSATFYNEGRREAALTIYNAIKAQLGLRGLKLLHKAQEEMMEYEERVTELAQEKEEDEA